METQTANTIEVTALVVQKTDYFIERNSLEHRTEKYAITKNKVNPKLVVRRGKPFEMQFTFQRKFDQKDDLISIVFTVKDAETHVHTKTTQVTVEVLDNVSVVLEDNWSAKIVKVEDNTVVVEVVASVQAIIGEYMISVDTKYLKKSALQSNPVEQTFILLFNPWNKRDSVFLEDSNSRDEYVLNENGLIWAGSSDKMQVIPWNFAQFDNLVLEACLYVLSSVGKLNVTDRADPIKVSRHISAVINANDDKGVLVGAWTATFEGGTAPFAWHGSSAILQQFYTTKVPVKFGQCWVFAGVVTTVCRCVGIPSRVVTNFQSAHDTQGNIDVDIVFTKDIKKMTFDKNDSVWNFHVWNEVWFKRPDLDSEKGAYDGWNAIDATPQERSEDQLFCCGPASVEAIKHGNYDLKYDTKFVYSETNADQIYWLKETTDPEVLDFKAYKQFSNLIGLNISTKAVGKQEKCDITESYKHKEKKHRDITRRRTGKKDFTVNPVFEDIRFESLILDDVVIGSPFNIRLKMYNKSNKIYTLNSCIGVRTNLYTGRLKSIVKEDIREIKVIPNTEVEILVTVTYDEYAEHLKDMCLFSITVVARVLGTEFDHCAVKDFRLGTPDIRIQTIGGITEGEPFTCNVFFMNPLPKTLTKGVFTIEGPDYSNRSSVSLESSVLVGAEAKASFTLVPKNTGQRAITVKFNSEELKDLNGFKNIVVAKH